MERQPVKSNISLSLAVKSSLFSCWYSKNSLVSLHLLRNWNILHKISEKSFVTSLFVDHFLVSGGNSQFYAQGSGLNTVLY